MRRNHNRTFYFINTVDSNGNDVVKVGSSYAPVWGQSFKNVADALEAIKRRNKSATRFEDVTNGVIAVYELESNNDGDSL